MPGLRTAAEEKLARARGAPEDRTGKTAEKVLHELQVHQIELEMQNEELKRAQVALEESRDKYLDLYDFAPVGYFTLTRKGEIAEANLAGAAIRLFFTLADDFCLKKRLNLCLFNGLSRLVERQEAEPCMSKAFGRCFGSKATSYRASV